MTVLSDICIFIRINVANMEIKHIVPDESDEFPTEERCHILELFNEADHRHFSLARARVEAGVTTAWHRLNDVEEYYYILSGTGQVEIGEDTPIDVQVGDVVCIPKGEAQRVRNTGVQDLLFLCYCMPAFSDACYEALE